MEPLNPAWRKSSYSGNGGANCVELGSAHGSVMIRDTKDNGAGPVLRVTRTQWQRFTTTIKG
jgi:hypothetical protein